MTAAETARQIVADCTVEADPSRPGWVAGDADHLELYIAGAINDAVGDALAAARAEWAADQAVAVRGRRNATVDGALAALEKCRPFLVGPHAFNAVAALKEPA